MKAPISVSGMIGGLGVKGGGVRKCAGGLMAFGEVFMKGERVFLSICLL